MMSAFDIIVPAVALGVAVAMAMIVRSTDKPAASVRHPAE